MKGNHHSARGGGPGRLARVRGRLTGNTFDDVMQGASSGLHVTAIAVPILAAQVLAGDLRVPEAAVIGSAQAAPLALALALFWWFRRGGMISQLAVSALWGLAGVALLGLILLPTRPGWASVAVISISMALVGAGAGVNYHVQGNKLGLLVDDVRRSFSGAHARPTAVSAAVREVAGVTTGRWKRWELLVGFVTAELVSLGLQSLGAWVTIAMFAAVLIGFAGLQFCWGGMPDRRPRAEATAGIWAFLGQGPDLQRNAWGSSVLYGAWWAVYAVVALFGAVPLIQASIAGVARGVAWIFVVWLGWLAGQRDRGDRVVRRLAILGAAGAVLLALCGPAVAWVPAGLGVCLTELGCNAMASALKSSLADTEDPVRSAHLGFMFRFVGLGMSSLILTGLWSQFSHDGVRDASRVAACALVILVIAARMILLRLVFRPGGHSVRVTASDELVLLVFSHVRGAEKTWFWIGTADDPRRLARHQRGQQDEPVAGFFGLGCDEQIGITSRRHHNRLLELRCQARLHRGHARVGRVVELPAGGPPCLRWRDVEICEPTRGSRVAGRLRRLTTARVTATLSSHTRYDRPAWVQQVLKVPPTEMEPDVDLNGRLHLYTIHCHRLRGKLTIMAWLLRGQLCDAVVSGSRVTPDPQSPTAQRCRPRGRCSPAISSSRPAAQGARGRDEPLRAEQGPRQSNAWWCCLGTSVQYQKASLRFAAQQAHFTSGTSV